MKKNHKWKYRVNIKKKILVLIILGVSLLVGLGYSILESNLNIFGTLDVAKYDKTISALIKKQVNMGCVKKYDGSHQDSIDASKSTEDIYYYDGTDYATCPIQNMNNVVFANKCWQMIRTTDTGGVRMVYNGDPEITENDGEIQYNCGDTRNLYSVGAIKSTMNLGGTYLYSKSYTATTNSSSATTTFTLNDPVSIAITSTNPEEQIEYISKNYPYTCRNTTGTCTNTQLYKVDSSAGGTNANLYTSTITDTIGQSQYNAPYTYLSNFGYMYENIYPYSSLRIFETQSFQFAKNVFDTGLKLDTNYYYADSIDWNTVVANKYTLLNPTQITSETDYSSLVGKYVMSAINGDSVYYVIGVYSTNNAFVKQLSNGDTDVSIVFSDSLTETGELSNPSSPVELKDWYVNYGNYKEKYTCGNSSSVCSTPMFIISTDSTRYVYLAGNIAIAKTRNGLELVDPEIIDYGKWYKGYKTTYSDYIYTCGDTSTTCTEQNLRYIVSKGNTNYRFAKNYYYGKSVKYEDNKYKLQDIKGLEAHSNLTDISTHHYVCLDVATKECSSVAYVFSYNVNDNMYYILLDDPSITNINDSLNIMLKRNTTSSMVKSNIDSWYEANIKNTKYESKVEDTIYCNDRSFSTKSGNTYEDSGWNANGGITTNYLFFRANDDLVKLDCINNEDKFSVSNNYAKLTYPIALMSAPEMSLLGSNTARKSMSNYWLLSPFAFRYSYLGWRYGDNITASIMACSPQGALGGGSTFSTNSIRPAISLVKDAKSYRGTGTMTDPYVIIPDDGWVLANSKTPISNQKFEYWENGSKVMSGWRDLSDLSGNPNTYYFKDGYSYHGWLELDGKKYYLSTFDDDGNGYLDGRRFNSETREIDGVSYTFDENGVCTNC